MKKAKSEFKLNPYKAGSLKLDQETTDQHKSFNLFDTNYDTLLGNLEGLPQEPPLLKKFNKSSFSYDDLFAILATRRNASAPGLNGILTRFTKVQKQTNFFSKFFMLVSKGAKSLYNGKVLKSYIFLRLALHLIPNSQTFAQ